MIPWQIWIKIHHEVSRFSINMWNHWCYILIWENMPINLNTKFLWKIRCQQSTIWQSNFQNFERKSKRDKIIGSIPSVIFSQDNKFKFIQFVYLRTCIKQKVLLKFALLFINFSFTVFIGGKIQMSVPFFSVSELHKCT